jgi:hypothetical protein
MYKAPRPNYFQLPTQWEHVYSQIIKGEWTVDPTTHVGKCTPKCISSSAQGCTNIPSMEYPNADNNEIAVTYRFAMSTKLRTSWQETALTVWESEAVGH